MAARIIIAVALMLASVACRSPQEVIFDEVAEGVRGSPNDRACDRAGDVTRETTSASMGVEEGDVVGLANVFGDASAKMRDIGHEAEGEVRTRLLDVGDVYADVAASIRALDAHGIQTAESRIGEATRALAAVCDGAAEPVG